MHYNLQPCSVSWCLAEGYRDEISATLQALWLEKSFMFTFYDQAICRQTDIFKFSSDATFECCRVAELQLFGKSSR